MRKIHVDFADPFVRSITGKTYLILAIDSLNKYLFALAVSACTAANPASFLVNRVI